MIKSQFSSMSQLPASQVLNPERRHTKVRYGEGWGWAKWWMAKRGWAYCSLNKSCPAIHTQLRVYFLSVAPSAPLTSPSFLRAKTGLGVRKNDAPRQTATHLWAVSTAIFTASGSLLVCAVFFLTLVFTKGPNKRKTEDIIKPSFGDFRLKIMFHSLFVD